MYSIVTSYGLQRQNVSYEWAVIFLQINLHLKQLNYLHNTANFFNSACELEWIDEKVLDSLPLIFFLKEFKCLRLARLCAYFTVEVWQSLQIQQFIKHTLCFQAFFSGEHIK